MAGSDGFDLRPLVKALSEVSGFSTDEVGVWVLKLIARPELRDYADHVTRASRCKDANDVAESIRKTMMQPPHAPGPDPLVARQFVFEVIAEVRRLLGVDDD